MTNNPTLHAMLIDAAVALPTARVTMRQGRVAVANWDEDAVTLGAAAALDILERTETVPVALVVATVTAPLREPGIAPFLAEVLNLQTSSGGRTIVAEHGGSVAAGGSALLNALALVAFGIEPVLMVTADTRRDTEGRAFGDASVALLIGAAGDGGVIAHTGSDVELFLDRWQDGTEGVAVGDRSLDRFGPDRTVGDRFSADAVVAGPTGPHVDRVGHAGSSHLPLLLLTGSGEPATYAASAGGVSHVFNFTPGNEFAEIAERARAIVAGGIESPAPVAPNLDHFDPFVSHAINRRERGATYRLEAVRDDETGDVIYPAPPTAAAAGMKPHRLARTGVVHTYARDHVFPIGGPATMAVVDLDGGGRFYAQVADGREVEIGDRVHLRLRRIHTGDGVPHYFWKVARDEEGT